MPANYLYTCSTCGHSEERYRNVRRCRKCGGALVRQEKTAMADGLENHIMIEIAAWYDRHQIKLSDAALSDAVRQIAAVHDQAQGRATVLEAQLGGWEAQCAAQVQAARAVLDHCLTDAGFERLAGDPDLEALLDELDRTINTGAGRLLLSKLEAQGRQFLRAEALAIAAAAALHELKEGGVIQEHTRTLLQSAIHAFEAGKAEQKPL